MVKRHVLCKLLYLKPKYFTYPFFIFSVRNNKMHLITESNEFILKFLTVIATSDNKTNFIAFAT